MAVAEAADLTLVTLPATLQAHLAAAELPRLAASGSLGDLLARQAKTHREDHNMAEPGREHPALPEDLVNFHSDPVACAVAIGWPGAVVEEPHLLPVLDAGVPRFEADNTGRPTRVVTRFDGEAAI